MNKVTLKGLLLCPKCNKVYEVTNVSDTDTDVDVYNNLSKYHLDQIECPECNKRSWKKIIGSRRVRVIRDEV